MHFNQFTTRLDEVLDVGFVVKQGLLHVLMASTTAAATGALRKEDFSVKFLADNSSEEVSGFYLLSFCHVVQKGYNSPNKHG